MTKTELREENAELRRVLVEAMLALTEPDPCLEARTQIIEDVQAMAHRVLA